jgi:pyruvate dehydrogenase E2 component (dihydrolipoamide acetyltransferase)
VAKQRVTVPDIGGAEGAAVIELLVAVGDEVALEQGLIVLESEKASMEIPSTAAGTVVELLVKVGDQLAEGAPVAVIEVADQAEAAAPAAEPPDTGRERGRAEPAAAEAAPPAGSAEPAGGGERVVEVPEIGTDEAVDLIEILVRVGDVITEGDSLVALESDKASMEVPAPFAGEVVKILVEDGAAVRQGDALVVLRVAEGVAAPPAAAPEPAAPHPAPQPAVEAATAATAATAAGVYAGPAVRKLAREFGIRLDQVSGSGPRGRILKEDLQQHVRESLSEAPPRAAAVAGIPPLPEVDFAAFGEVEVVPRSKLDKLTAANMQRSWLNLPHVTQFDEGDVTDLEAFRAGLRTEAERRGARLTPMPFLLKACAVALREHPKLNSSLADGGDSLVYKKYFHIGMAVDTPAGLVVPVIRDVDRKNVWELAEEVLETAARARDRKLTPVQMQGACFTVTSLGNIGGNGFTPIINAPEVAILGVSRVATRPVWDGQAFAPRKMLPLALSYDHRVINGGDAGRFLTDLVALLGDIRRVLL